MVKRSFLPLLIFSLLLAGCAPTPAPSPTIAPTAAATHAAPTTEAATTAPTMPATEAGPRTLTVMSHDSFQVSEDVVAAFEEEHNAEIKFLLAGDTGTALNQAILSRDNPLADVFYGIDNTFLGRALAEDIFVPYDSPRLTEIPDRFLLDEENRALPVDYGDVCLNYDKGYFETEGIEPPRTLRDLTEPRYQDLLTVENPATSSPGLAFLLTTIGNFGAEDYLAYWQDLQANGLKVVNDWETAYYSDFTIHGGTRPIVVSYGSSPPAEVYFAEDPPAEPPTGVVTAGESCFRQIEFVGILRGTGNRALAEAWVDFMLSPTFQEDMPLNMFVFPVLPDAELPQVFAEHLVVPDKTADVSPATIDQNRATWIAEWTEAVLR